MNDEIELLPCPFCGGNAVFGITQEQSYDFIITNKTHEDLADIVVCIECGAKVEYDYKNKSLIEKWNTRCK